MSAQVDKERLAVVILAAGEGKRMKSSTPKVLHRACGRPIVEYVVEAVGPLGAGKVMLVIGHGADEVREATCCGVASVVQEEQKGTGHAVMVALEELGREFDEVLVLPGDSPLILPESLEALLATRRATGAAASLATAVLDDPHGYGRVIRDGKGAVERIVEQTDGGRDELAVREVNACTYVFDRSLLEPALEALTPNNAQGEYYLTEVVEAFVSEGKGVIPVTIPAEQTLGVNDRIQLAEVAAVIGERINRELMRSGVTLVDPGRTYIDSGVSIGCDTVVMPLTFLTGETRIGGGCRIGPCTSINDSVIADGAEIEFSWVDGTEVGPRAQVGPYSRLRPGCKVGPGARVGSFVEMKNTTLGEGSKVPHLSYMGDAQIGKGANVGAGSITCNYDGENKYPTEIADGAFVGSDTMMVAPVRIGREAVTGAGSTIYEDIPDGALGIERSEQKNVPGFRKRKRKKSKD